MGYRNGIRSVRYGWATSSSSVHSIVATPHLVHDVPPETRYGYGWESFVLVSPAAKLRYVTAQLEEHRRVGRDVDAVTEALESEYPQYMKHILGEQRSLLQIDHESQWHLPGVPNNPQKVHPEFTLDFVRCLLQKDVVIIGGTDHVDEHLTNRLPTTQPMQVQRSWFSSLQDLLEHNPDLVAYRNGNYWLLRSPQVGDRFRVAFHTLPLTPEVPELIDIKITDYCTVGCYFCYQNSGPEGQHADPDRLCQLLAGLPSGCEVVLGGGDPMSYPALRSVLAATQHLAAVNITVRDLTWLRDTDRVSALSASDNVKAIGVSIQTPNDLFFNYKRLRQVFPDKQIVIHVVPELYGGQNGPARDALYRLVVDVLAASSDEPPRVLLLGTKHTGRAATMQTKKLSQEFLTIFCEQCRGYAYLAADTKMIMDYPFLAHDPAFDMYAETEGLFSMYLNAVDWTAHPASYILEPAIAIREVQRECLTEIFAAIRKSSSAS